MKFDIEYMYIYIQPVYVHKNSFIKFLVSNILVLGQKWNKALDKKVKTFKSTICHAVDIAQVWYADFKTAEWNFQKSILSLKIPKTKYPP